VCVCVCVSCCAASMKHEACSMKHEACVNKVGTGGANYCVGLMDLENYTTPGVCEVVSRDERSPTFSDPWDQRPGVGVLG